VTFEGIALANDDKLKHIGHSTLEIGNPPCILHQRTPKRSDIPMSQPAQDRLEIEQHLRQLNDEWVKALVRGDVETLDRVMADDFFFAYPMEGDDKSQFIDDVGSGEIRVEYLNRENVSVRIWGNTAVLSAHDSAKWFYGGRDFSGHYKVVAVYAQREGKWELVAVQACPII
jgi:ketosteroid isomerase-like protein